MKSTLHNKELIYPELSYKLIGIAYEVYNQLGYGHLEKTYQRAFAKELTDAHIPFKEQIKYSVDYKGANIGNNFFDFLVEDIVIVELKKSGYPSKKNMEQVSNYLKVSGLKLGLLVIFTSESVRQKRIVNDF